MQQIDTNAMLGDLERLVRCESKTGDFTALSRCATELATIGDRLLAPHASAEIVDTAMGPIVMWRFGDTPRVGLIGHYDTVHPAGTLERFDFSVVGDTIRGPGTYDMKAGLMVALYGCAAALAEDPASLDGVVIFCNPDEEDGSNASIVELRKLVASGMRTAFVFEGGGDGGELRTARKGGMWLRVTLHGKDAHGSRPEEGINAIDGIADYLERLPMMASPLAGTSVVPTMINAGTAINTAPGTAQLVIDVRTMNDREQQRVLEAFQATTTRRHELRAEFEVLHRFSAMPESSSQALMQHIVDTAELHNMGSVKGSLGMGATDATHLAAMGIEVIDGLGPSGGNDHSPDEWASVSSMVDRARLVAKFVPSIVSKQGVPSATS